MFSNLKEGLKYCADTYYKLEKERWADEHQSVKLGLIDDETKLRFLKDYLFSRVHGDRDITNLVQAIATIEESIDRKHRRDNEPLAVINSFICTGVALSFLVACFSFPVTALCKQSRSPFCNTSRQITNTRFLVSSSHQNNEAPLPYMR